MARVGSDGVTRSAFETLVNKNRRCLMQDILRLTLILLAAFLTLAASAGTNAASCPRWPETIYLLRHAEKRDQTDDSPLSSAGWQRAGGLPRALSRVQVGAILVSDKQRTRQTAMALEADTGMTPRAFAQSELKELIEAVCAAGQSKGKAVVVVGHTTTVPEVMKSLGLKPLTPEFGDLYVVNTATWSVEQRRYGDCSEGDSQLSKVNNHE